MATIFKYTGSLTGNPDGTLLTAYTPGGADVSATFAIHANRPASAAVITSGRIRPQGSPMVYVAGPVPGTAEQTLTARSRVVSTAIDCDEGILVRMDTTLEQGYELRLDVTAGSIKLIRLTQSGGTVTGTTLATYAHTYVVGEDIDYSLHVSDPVAGTVRLVATINGAAQTAYDDTSGSRITIVGRFGIRSLLNAGGSSGQHFTTLEGADASTANTNPTVVIDQGATATAVEGTSTLDLSATVTDAEDGAGGAVVWTSANTAIATVNSSTGVVTAVKPGLVTITATRTDTGGLTGSDTISVRITAAVPRTLRFFGGWGQSNAEGKGNSSLSPAVPANTAFEYRAGDLLQLADPVGGATTGSLWPALANRVYDLTGWLPAIYEGATGGTAMVAAADSGNGNWSPTGTLRAALSSAVLAAITELEAQGHTVTNSGFIGSQGERDAQAIDLALITKAQYKSGLEGFIAYLRGIFGPTMPFFIIQTGHPDSGDTTGFQQVRAAQQEVADADPYTWMGSTSPANFPEDGKMTDDLHWNQAGLNLAGTETGTVIAAALLENTAPTISINEANQTLVVGGSTFTYTATVADTEDDPDPSPVWTSGNPAVATVNASTGVVTPVAPGSTAITATVTDVGMLSATASRTVTVEAAPPPPSEDPPATPTMGTPTRVGDILTLVGSVYDDPEDDAHAASQWQIQRAGGDWSAPVFNSGEDGTNLESIEVDLTGFAPGNYVARVRYKDDSA